MGGLPWLLGWSHSPLPSSPASARATGGYFTPRPVCKSSVPRSAAQGVAGYPRGTPSPSLTVHVPTVLSTTGRALQAAGRGAQRVQLCPGVCLCPPGALPACGAACCHAGSRCPDPLCPDPLPTVPIPRVPQGASPRCQQGGRVSLAALGAQGGSSGGCGSAFPTCFSPGTGRGPVRAAPGAPVGRQPDGGGDLLDNPGLVPGCCGGVCTGNGTVPGAGWDRRAQVSPRPHAAPLLQVCREQDLLLFLQDHPAFSLAPEQRFQLTGMEEVSGEGVTAARWELHSHHLVTPVSLPRCACCHQQMMGPAWRRRRGAGPCGWPGTTRTRLTARR